MLKVAVTLSLGLALSQDVAKDLVGHWKFDDGKEAKAANAVEGGPAGNLVKEPTWAEAGKVGGALVFDGTHKYVEIPNTAELENVQEGSYTLACWYKPEALPTGAEEDNTGSHCLIIKQGWHLGLRYNLEGRFVLDHWVKGEKEDEPQWKGGGTWDTSYDPGKWYHVAGVVDRAAGTVKVYVDGEQAGSGEFDADAPAREYKDIPWRIGIGGPGAEKWSWPAKGAIDDVRIYKRALTDADVAELTKLAK